MKIAVVTDSTCDIPSEIVREHQIHVVPNILVLDGESLEDGTGISRQDFYDRLPALKEMPTTASASSGSYQALYECLFREGAHFIISIHASGLLSGILNAASIAAQTFGERVRIIDSGQVSMGLGFQVLAAAEALAQGKSLEDALARVADVKQRIRMVAMLDTLEYVQRSGRVSWARAYIGNLLRIKPFIELKNGVVFSLGEVRTRRKGIERLVQLLLSLGQLERLAILHTNAEQEARHLLNKLVNHISSPPVVVNVTTIIGTHVGPNGLGFAAVAK